MTKLSDVLDSKALEIFEYDISTSVRILHETQCTTPYEVIDALKKEVARVDPLDPRDYVYRLIQLLSDHQRNMIEDPLCFVFSDALVPHSTKKVRNVGIIRRILCGTESQE
jgi:hypothetical protein